MIANYATEIARVAGLPEAGVSQTIALLDAEATIPFIARYRKEATGGLDEVRIAEIRDRLDYLKRLDERKETILRTIEQQGKLTAELREKIEQTRDAAELEDLYLPYKPKRKTRASEAIARGLEPLADLIWKQETLDGDPDALAAPFVDAEKGVPDVAAAWQGARDIVAERISELPALRAALRELYLNQGTVTAKAKPGKEKDGAKFRDYFHFSEAAKSIPSHRMLAIRRGEAEDVLLFRITADRDQAMDIVHRHVIKNATATLVAHLLAAAEDSYDRLLVSAIEGHARQELRQRSDRMAISVFAKNLRRLLMAPPLGAKWVLGIDPGLRTGSKMVALDGKGDLLASTVIDILHNKEKIEQAIKSLEFYCRRYQIEAIAVGNGTGSREVESFLRGLDREQLNDATVVQVNEAGASVYSASEIARQEFPDLDLTIRGAISIARRLQDPLAELVKIDPKSIGVGQYQHDVDQDALQKSLDDVVQSCVNAVGVDLNTASPKLLASVSGLNAARAAAIVKYRSAHGVFRNRQELLAVNGIGPKTFEQAAGFLRIRNGEQPLDASAVHPERYPLVQRMATDLGVDVTALMNDAEQRAKIKIDQYISEDVGLPTLQDILAELAKPGRDPREKFDPVRFDPNVTTLHDLREGMLLEGVVTNVTDFGAFVDIGVHQDGLVHLSELAWNYVENPTNFILVGEHLTVKVIGVDLDRKRISLSLKQTTETPPRPPQQPRPPQPAGERPPRREGPPRPPQSRPPRQQAPTGGRPPAAAASHGGKDRPGRQNQPRHESPFAKFFMEDGKIKMKEEPEPKGKPPAKKK